MLTFTLENLSGGETPYKNLLKREIDIISGFDDNYLLHDHLEQCNEPCYFHEFMTKASAKGLQYLGDVDVATMYLGNFSRTARDTLAQVTDIIRQEQYLDFLSDRRFRSSLLCHADVELSRNLSVDRLAGFLFTTVLTRKDGFSSVDLSVDGPVVFDYLTTGDTVTSATRAGTAAICALGDSAARPLSVDEVVAKAVALLGDVPGDVVRQTFLEFAGQLLLSGAIEIALDPGFQVTEVSERPEAWSVARHKAVSANYVPNVLHRGVKLGDDARVMLQYVDGTRTVDEIIDAYVPNFFNGNLTYMIDGVAVTNEDKIRGSMAPIVTNGLRVFAASSLLVA
jgi:methyltransferase-like protein